MKKITIFICLLLIIATFAFMFVYCIFFPRTTVSDYSILAEWPEFSVEALFSGEYFNDVMYCFTDTIHGRDRFIDFETKINSLYGLPEEEKVVIVYPDDESNDAESSIAESVIPESSEIVDNSDISDETSFESTFIPDESEASKPEDSSAVEQAPPEIAGSILIVKTRALEIYYGSEKNAKVYAETLNAFAEQLDPSVKVYSMVIPKACAYYLEQAEGYDNLIYRNKRDIDKIAETLSDRVIDVNIYNTLGQHANEEIYFRTDHHWTSLGAYYAATVLADKAGVAIDDLESFREERREGYLGTMYKYSDYSTTLLNNPEDFVAYYPDASYTATYYSPTDLKSSPRDHEGGFFWEIGDNQKSSWYSTFIRGDSYSVKAVSDDCKNGRKLLIVKDSYGNALAPYTLEGFEEVYIVDARQYQRSLKETIEEFGITDVLFAECSFSAVGGSYIDHLKELCK